MPGSDDRVGDRNENRCKNHERGKLDAFSYSTRHDRGGSSGEHRLEDEVTESGHGQISSTVSESVSTISIQVPDWKANFKPSVEVSRIMSVKANQSVTHDTNRNDEAVFK